MDSGSPHNDGCPKSVGSFPAVVFLVLPTGGWFLTTTGTDFGQATELQEALDAKELKKLEEELRVGPIRSPNGDYMEVSIAMGVPPNGWFIMGNPMTMDDLGVPSF